MEIRSQAKKGEEESDAGFSPSYTDLGSDTDTEPLSVMQKHRVTWCHRLRVIHGRTDYAVTPSVTWKPWFLSLGAIHILDWTVFVVEGCPVPC